MTHLANSFEQAIARFYSESELEKLQNVVVGILGAGGLGSNCAVNLVRSGRHEQSQPTILLSLSRGAVQGGGFKRDIDYD